VKNPFILGGLFVGAFVAAVIYFKPEPSSHTASPTQTVSNEGADAEPARPAGDGLRGRSSGGTPSGPRDARSSQAAPDPRLAALEVSPDNGLIEFVRGSDGKVIAEIDKDPSSPGFQKPLREYLYSDGRVVGVTSYRYFPDHVEVSRTAVSYKPDGSVDEYSESTSFDGAKVKPKRDR
jgi:hypothetical protein